MSLLDEHTPLESRFDSQLTQKNNDVFLKSLEGFSKYTN